MATKKAACSPYIVSMNVIYERLPCCLKSILSGDVPNVEWELISTPQLESSLAKAIGQWEYIGSAFRIGCRDTRCRVPLMPTLHFCALVVGRIPSLPMAVEIVQSSPLADGDLSARVYSAYTGFLREMACGLEFVRQGYRVFKNPKRDLQEGVDWICRQERLVQVSMAGQGSSWHWANRKADKTSQDVIKLVAQPSAGLATVSASDISTAFSPCTMAA